MFDSPHVNHKAEEILKQIAELGPMRRGSLCKRFLKRKTRKGKISSRGPYWYYTFKKDNQTRCKTISEDSEPLYREQIARFRRFQELIKDYVALSHQKADQEAAGKKNSSS